MDVVVASLATLLVGLTVGWLVARTRISRGMATIRRERDAASSERDTARAERDGARVERDGLRTERDAAAQRASAAEIKVAATGARLAALAEAEQQLKDTFARMSTEALQANQQQFIDLADDRFKQAGRPLTETLDKVGTQLREIEKERAGAQRALSEQIEFVRTTGERLRAETASLVSALRKPQARGQWGELQLRRCVEYAGMLDRCDFTEQASVAGPDGLLRPDLIVNLVGGKTIVVDSKVTLIGYLDAHDAADETTGAEHLVRHARHLRTHVDALAAKSYWTQFSNSPEFVIMFVPGDGPLNAALETDPTLLEYAFAKRVHILGPMSLVPTLRVIAYAWQQAALADNAREVFELGKELYARLGTFSGHMGSVGSQLSKSVKAYNDAVRSLEGRLLVTARRFNDLDLVDDDLPELIALEDSIVPLSKPELVEHAEPKRTIRAVAPAPVTAVIEGLERLDDYGINSGNPAHDRRTGS